MIFNYGDLDNKYDMDGEIKIGTGTVKVHDIFQPMPAYMMTADCLFVDPPCSRGNLRTFYTKNQTAPPVLDNTVYEKFTNGLFNYIEQLKPARVFVEVFKSNVDEYMDRLSGMYKNAKLHSSYYYNQPKNKCWIIQASNDELVELPEVDEEKIIAYICENVPFQCIADPCMGRGLVGYYANKNGKKFVGTELNKKRLAVLLERINTGRI